MSRSFFKNFMAALIFSCAAVANAHDFEVNGIYYRIYGVNSVLVTFNWDPYSAPTGGLYAGNVVIPESVAYNGIDYRVTGIEYQAFYECPALLSVKIPNSITTIGGLAFYRCSGLTSIEIPSSVETIGDGAFTKCGALESIMVDENNVAYDSRNNCNALIETATNTLLRGCENTVVPHSVTSIGSNAFDDCITLASIEIPNSVTSIGSGAFSRSGLTSIEIPNSVTSIGSGAFGYCELLNEIVLPQGAICIGGGAFENTPWYKKFSHDDDGCLYINNILFDVNNFLGKSSFKVKEGTVAIAGGAFPNYSDQFKTIEIPNSVKAIGHSAFSYCFALTNVNIPDGVTIIGNEAFCGCSGLTSIKIPNGVTRIGDETFSGCIELKEIEIPNSVTSIGNRAFFNCSNLTSIKIPESVKVIDDEAFDGASIEKVYITDLSAWCKMDYNGNSRMGDIYLNGEKIVNLVIPDDVKVFNNNCFRYNQSIVSVKIGDNLESVGQFVFEGCNNIAEIYIESKDYQELYNAFEYNVKQSATVYVPKGRKDDYKYIFNPDNIVEVAHTLKYVIDGNVYKTEELGFGETISSTNPVKEGYTFCGWEEHPATMPNNELTVNGSFKVNQYTVTYLINGDTYKTETYDYGTAVLPIENIQRKGYTFSGWSQTLTTMPAKDVTITSSLTANKYTIKYMVDGLTYTTKTYEYGELIQPPFDPSKNGYTFAGWSSLPERMPANDIVVTADFIKSDTAIDDVNSDAVDVAIYDLNGNRVTNPTKGVYIINGKKVFVK